MSNDLGLDPVVDSKDTLNKEEEKLVRDFIKQKNQDKGFDLTKMEIGVDMRSIAKPMIFWLKKQDSREYDERTWIRVGYHWEGFLDLIKSNRFNK